MARTGLIYAAAFATLTASLSIGCGDGTSPDSSEGPAQGPGASEPGGSSGGSSGINPGAGTPDGSGNPAAPSAPSSKVTVHLVPESAGAQRVNFAVPFGKGWLDDESRVRVTNGGAEVPIARRVLSKHSDGSVRSVQLQMDLDVRAEMDLEVSVGDKGAAASLTLVPVEQTLIAKSGSQVPKTWARLPAAWLSASAVTGLQLPEAETTGAPAAFTKICNYTRFNADAFATAQSDSAVWLYDRPTTLYRGYARRGDQSTLASAYREVGIYRAGLKGTGASTTIGLTDKATDLKYYYTQGLALHFLLTGDDRYREAAENVALRIETMWQSPEYKGGFWTERHAGFALLGYVWAQIVTDDRGPKMAQLADAAVAGYVKTQERAIDGHADKDARCFAHTADSAGEDFGYTGCSPWLSAILADGLETYARERSGAQAESARTSLVKLGRILAKSGRDDSGKPYYWMGVGTAQGEADPDDEHWGEPAYVVAMAWHYGGRTDATLKKAAEDMLGGLSSNGSAPHMRSFNWQCRSAVGAAYYLK